MRDYTDFDVIDENMILDGALDKYHVLAMFDGNFTEQAVYDKIDAWVKNGGSVVMQAEQLPFTNVDGAVLPVSKLTEEANSGGAVSEEGDGQWLIWSGDWADRSDYYQLIYDTAYSSSSTTAGGGWDGNSDGVWTSVFTNRALYYNTTDAPVNVCENISEELARSLNLSYLPKYLDYSVEVPAKGLAVHFFDRPFVEIALECENMAGVGKRPPTLIYRGGYGEPGTAIKLDAKTRISASFSIRDDALYGFACLVDPLEESQISLEVDGRKVGDVTGPTSYHKFMYPIQAKIHLKPGKHSLALRVDQGSCLADKVMVTTDTGLSGFTYGFIDPKADQSW